ncbi:MAG TPA: DNA ligase D [Methylomirabilota bacterium]|jgi:bifunctional non-homologous end joining protein LigD|nr:DNA ligase D [Methylomirabilota bacterium]
MGLREYRRKRNFKKTPEPSGKAAPRRRKGELLFVVQKHAASRLHYDFRLELDGVLKSWAVPKGPSLDPADKRLAMHVEDHPLEYGSFEGIIPKGEYGGGTVLLWDRGTWEPVGDPHQAYRAGNLKFVLKGEKLRGGWALVRIRGGRRGDDSGRSWLLIKERDAEARSGRSANVVELKPKSVLTGRTLEEIAAAEDRVWHSDGDGGKKTATPRKPPAAPRPAPARRSRGHAPVSVADVPGARHAALPKFVPPQLATLVSQAPSGDAWLHEMKYDGYRILARLDHGRVRLLSRNGRDWTEKFPSIAEAVGHLLAERAMLDGEIAVLHPDGTTSFQALQNFLSGTGRGQLVYMVFDLLHLNGWDLTGARLEERKAVLERLLASGNGKSGSVRYSDHVAGDGPDFFTHACRLGLEGVVAKRRDAQYRSTRGADWLKIKCVKRQEVVIGGYTDPEGSRIGIGALLVGVYEDGRLVYAGKVGTGFDQKTLRALKKRLAPLEQKACPFATNPTGVGRPHWVKPELVAEVSFSEWTADGKMRHPSFQGLREDKPATSVVRELPVRVEEVVEMPTSSTKTAKGKNRQSPTPASVKGPGEAVVAGVRLTHADRVLYPAPKTTKRDLALFYESIADWILPHLAGRPTALVRCPEGVAKECFYQKHVGTWAPESLRRVKIRERTKIGEYLVVDSLAALIGLVQIGILEIHTWNSVVERLEQPDRLVFDLDPGPGVTWKRVVEGARLIRERLLALHLESFVKTTGGKGLHVVAPLSPGPTWDEGAAFARTLAQGIAREDPRGYVAHMAKSVRQGKIFIDYLRNVRGATSVAAYSTRAKPSAPVSVPLGWEELSPAITSDHYTIVNLPRRLAGLKVDPWARYWTIRQKLPKVGALEARPVAAARRA